MGGLRFQIGQFTLFKRGKVFYYWTYDRYGKRHRFSTGKTKKTEAFSFCIERMSAGNLICHTPVVERITLSDYGKNFWNYETCPIIQSKILRGGHYSVKMATNHQALFDHHIKPFLGDKDLSSLTSSDIESWLLHLPGEKGLSNKTANNAFETLRQMLNQAVLDNYIDKNPALNIKPLINKSIRREAFTHEEVKALLSREWDNEFAYTACYLASRTGMRIGEVRALTREQIHPDYIEVNASWSDQEGRKTTKSGWSRIIPITEELYELLMKYAPPLGGLIFSLNGIKPVKGDYFGERLRKKMDECGIDYINNNLSFHSFRHFFNTRMLAADISGEKVRAVLGHESESMTTHYAHLSQKDLNKVKELQQAL